MISKTPLSSKYHPPVPCHHIHKYYTWKWTQKNTLGSNFLRWGYYQWSCGKVKYDDEFNNLYSCTESPSPITLGALP